MTGAVVFSPESVKILLENGGYLNALDDNGLTLILCAAHNDGNYPNLALLNLLLEKDDIPREDKIDALEMAGAVILCSPGLDEEGVALAFNFWRRALTLRLMDTKDCRPIWKTHLKTKNGSLPEWTSLDDLLQIEMDPTEREMQSLLVQLRILSSLGWRAVRQHFWPSIMKLMGKTLNGERTFSQILDITWALCNTVLRAERPHETDLVSTLSRFVSVSIIALEKLQKENPILNSVILKKLVEIVFFMADPTPCFTEGINNLENPLSDFPAILCDQLLSITSNHPQFISEEIRPHLVHFVGRGGIRDSAGLTLLIRACHNLDCGTIRFLVQLGADPNARGKLGIGALHILAVKENGELRDAAARLILELGAHLDLATDEGLTATVLWLNRNNQQRQHLPDWLQEGVPKLMCLSSRVIRHNKLPYKENNVLPVVLVPFVSLH